MEEEYVSHPLIKDKTVQSREYQNNIVDTASKKNCLVVVSTGLGKTLISILVAANRLQQFPESKVMILSPTRLLCAQIQKAFEESIDIEPEKIVLITGKIRPEDREYLYSLNYQ